MVVLVRDTVVIPVTFGGESTASATPALMGDASAVNAATAISNRIAEVRRHRGFRKVSIIDSDVAAFLAPSLSADPQPGGLPVGLGIAGQ